MVALRIPAAMGWGTLVTAGLFALLSSLVNTPLEVIRAVAMPDINFTRKIVSTPVDPVRPHKPVVVVLPPLPPGPPGPRIRDPEVTTPGRGEWIAPPNFGTEIPTDTAAVGVDRDPLPVVRFDPDYPQRAINGEIEGWAEVQFSVTATGAVRDVVIVDSHPKNVFDDAVIKAVGRWRYNPKVDEGVAVERVGMRTRILFELDRAQAN